MSSRCDRVNRLSRSKFDAVVLGSVMRFVGNVDLLSLRNTSRITSDAFDFPLA